MTTNRAAELERRQRSAAITIALQRSKRVIEAKIRASGHKVSQYSARDLRVLAEQYFEEHRADLLADATRTVERWTAEGVFGKRAQRAYGCLALHNLSAGVNEVGQTQLAESIWPFHHDRAQRSSSDHGYGNLTTFAQYLISQQISVVLPANTGK